MAFRRFHPAGARQEGVISPMVQVPGAGTETDSPPARRRPRRGLELAGLAIGIVAGVGIALAWLLPGRGHPAGPVAVSSNRPVLVGGSSGEPGPAALDAEWVAYSDHSTCADWAGGDGVSAIRLNSSQLGWFFSDTTIGPAGPTIGFSDLSGFVHNSLVIQTATGRGSTFVTMTGGGACTGPGGPGNAAPVIGPRPKHPGGPADPYWEEDGIKIGGTVVKFYNHYKSGLQPYRPVGTVIATFAVSQLSAAGRGPQYGAVARPHLVPLPSYTPAARGTPILWGAALLQVGQTVYIYGTQSPGVAVPDRLLYLARVPASQLTAFPAWQFYAGAGRWAAGQDNARPVQPPDRVLNVSSGFSVVQVGGGYWLIQAGTLVGTGDIDAYPAPAPWGPFDPAAGRLLYRDPAIGLDAAHEYRIMYEARAEPALSPRNTLVISYNVNSEAVTTGCVPMSNFTNTVILPRFISVPLAVFGSDPGGHVYAAQSGPPDYPPILQRNPSQWFDAWNYPDDCPPVPGVVSVRATPDAGKVTLTWPDAGLDIHYYVYLQGPGEPGDAPVTSAYADNATITGLRPGRYRARVVPVDFYRRTGSAAEVTFTVP
jgi:hypothetical protein